MSFNWGGLAQGVVTGFGQAFQTLITPVANGGQGMTNQQAHSILSMLSGPSLGSEEQPFINTIVAQYQNPAIVQKAVEAALSVSNPPPSATIITLLNQIPIAATAAAGNIGMLGNFMSLVGGLEKELGI